MRRTRKLTLSVMEALAPGRSDLGLEWPSGEAMREKVLVGTAATVGTRLQELADELPLDEIGVNPCAHDPAVLRASYALVTREFALPEAA